MGHYCKVSSFTRDKFLKPLCGTARQQSGDWLERLEVLRELAVGPSSPAERGNGGGAEPVDPVLAARQRRAARQHKRQQAARAAGTTGEAAAGADAVAAAEAGPRLEPFASGWSFEGDEEDEDQEQGEEEDGGEAGARMQTFASGWSIEVDEDDEDEEVDEEDGDEGQWQEASGSEVTEELYNIDSGWSLEALGASDDNEARLRTLCKPSALPLTTRLHQATAQVAHPASHTLRRSAQVRIYCLRGAGGWQR